MLEILESDTNFSQILEFNDGDFLCKIMGESNAWIMVKKDPIGGILIFCRLGI